MFSTLYRLPALPILPVNSIIFTILPVNLKPGKSSTLLCTTATLENQKTWPLFRGWSLKITINTEKLGIRLAVVDRWPLFRGGRCTQVWLFSQTCVQRLHLGTQRWPFFIGGRSSGVDCIYNIWLYFYIYRISLSIEQAIFISNRFN